LIFNVTFKEVFELGTLLRFGSSLLGLKEFGIDISFFSKKLSDKK
jgi:hypothetical protein